MKLRIKGMLTVTVAVSMAALLNVQALATELIGHGTAVVTVINDHNAGAHIAIPQQDLRLWVDGHPARVSHWTPATNQLQLVLLVDSSAWGSMGKQRSDIRDFIRSLPASVEAGIGYMEKGRAVLAGPLSRDRNETLRQLHVPSNVPHGRTDPYFCLAGLANHWPSRDVNARREVIMITNGVEDYENDIPLRQPDDPGVQAAIQYSVRAGLVVYSIHWLEMNASPAAYLANGGVHLLALVSRATGGESYSDKSGNPASFAPYFAEIAQQFKEQYYLEFSTSMQVRFEAASMKLTVKTSPVPQLIAPGQVWLTQLGQANRNTVPQKDGPFQANTFRGAGRYIGQSIYSRK